VILPFRLQQFLLACLLLVGAGLASAEPDLSAPDASAAVAAGKLTLVDIRTPPEWKQTHQHAASAGRTGLRQSVAGGT